MCVPVTSLGGDNCKTTPVVFRTSVVHIFSLLVLTCVLLSAMNGQ
jgi:hypothetical protein